MAWKNRLDLHTHTDNSFDGNHSTTLLCETAAEKKLRAVAFTDHVEMDVYLEQHFDRTAKQSFFEIIKARSAFRGKLIVCAGVELGEPTYNLPEAEALLRQYSYDIVIGSIHNLRGRQDFWYLPYDSYDDATIAALLREYFDELLQLAAWGRFDTLAHLTYPLRYICGEHGFRVNLGDYAEQIDAILETAAHNKLALEINTSGLRQKLGKTMPEESVVRRFRELGGERITLGSDAHFAEHLGAGLEEGMELALRCGFTHMTLFQRREPIAIAIE
ncbi:MAG: histidinol-phosphatase HisJ family protein [Oscillospiraceae bacterium]|jgi:histidinol-phosphatase (PHP family)|nr:histidinol-phosphatase HisJ family protein [Oscillospiraceae bacterium]